MNPRRTPGALLRATLAPYLHIDDPWVVDVALATVVANVLPGDPLWLLLVSPPGSGKTELVQLFRRVPWCDWLAQVTENTFLSGLQRATALGGSQRAPEHSLLFRWTDPVLRAGKPPVRVMLVQDLTSLITMRREKRDDIFGQLREIYDGRLGKRTGMGDDLLWEGYLGLLGAVTPKYDDVAELYSTLGERFLLYRPLRIDPDAEARAAVSRDGADDWRSVVADVAAAMVELATANLAKVTILPWALDRLIGLARLTAAGRATVSRDGYNKVIRVMPEAEGPARLVQQFRKLLHGLCAVRGLVEPGEAELLVIAKVARDTMPSTRLAVLRAVAGGAQTRDDVVRATRLSRSTCEYLLQDLEALDVVRRRSPQRGDAEARELTPEYQDLVTATRFFAEPESRNVRETRTGNQKDVAVGVTDRDSGAPVGDLGGGVGGPAKPDADWPPCALCGRPVPRDQLSTHVQSAHGDGR